MKNTKIKAEKNKEKKHIDIGKSFARIIALLLACGTVLYYIVLSAKGLI